MGIGLGYYVFYPDQRVAVHETWPEDVVKGTYLYQPSDEAWPWAYSPKGGYTSEIIQKHTLPGWIKAYLLLID